MMWATQYCAHVGAHSAMQAYLGGGGLGEGGEVAAGHTMPNWCCGQKQGKLFLFLLFTCGRTMRSMNGIHLPRTEDILKFFEVYNAVLHINYYHKILYTST